MVMSDLEVEEAVEETVRSVTSDVMTPISEEAMEELRSNARKSISQRERELNERIDAEVLRRQQIRQASVPIEQRRPWAPQLGRWTHAKTWMEKVRAFCTEPWLSLQNMVFSLAVYMFGITDPLWDLFAFVFVIGAVIVFAVIADRRSKKESGAPRSKGSLLRSGLQVGALSAGLCELGSNWVPSSIGPIVTISNVLSDAISVWSDPLPSDLKSQKGKGRVPDHPNDHPIYSSEEAAGDAGPDGPEWVTSSSPFVKKIYAENELSEADKDSWLDMAWLVLRLKKTGKVLLHSRLVLYVLAVSIGMGLYFTFRGFKSVCTAANNLRLHLLKLLPEKSGQIMPLESAAGTPAVTSVEVKTESAPVLVLTKATEEVQASLEESVVATVNVAETQPVKEIVPAVLEVKAAEEVVTPPPSVDLAVELTGEKEAASLVSENDQVETCDRLPTAVPSEDVLVETTTTVQTEVVVTERSVLSYVVRNAQGLKAQAALEGGNKKGKTKHGRGVKHRLAAGQRRPVKKYATYTVYEPQLDSFVEMWDVGEDEPVNVGLLLANGGVLDPGSYEFTYADGHSDRLIVTGPDHYDDYDETDSAFYAGADEGDHYDPSSERFEEVPHRRNKREAAVPQNASTQIIEAQRRKEQSARDKALAQAAKDLKARESKIEKSEKVARNVPASKTKAVVPSRPSKTKLAEQATKPTASSKPASVEQTTKPVAKKVTVVEPKEVASPGPEAVDEKPSAAAACYLAAAKRAAAHSAQGNIVGVLPSHCEVLSPNPTKFEALIKNSEYICYNDQARFVGHVYSKGEHIAFVLSTWQGIWMNKHVAEDHVISHIQFSSHVINWCDMKLLHSTKATGHTDFVIYESKDYLERMPKRHFEVPMPGMLGAVWGLAGLGALSPHSGPDGQGVRIAVSTKPGDCGRVYLNTSSKIVGFHYSAGGSAGNEGIAVSEKILSLSPNRSKSGN
jgi:hypothetical protein